MSAVLLIIHNDKSTNDEFALNCIRSLHDAGISALDGRDYSEERVRAECPYHDVILRQGPDVGHHHFLLKIAVLNDRSNSVAEARVREVAERVATGLGFDVNAAYLGA